MSNMPEELENEEGKTLENSEPIEGEEEKPTEEPSEPKEEKKKEEPDEEPKKRFPKESEDNRLGYKLRKLEEENKRLKAMSDDDLSFADDEDDKPITRKELNSIMQKTERDLASDRMLQEFLSQNPDYKKYERKIRKYVNDPDYSNVPIGFIASGIVGENIDDEANERANLKVKADEEANRTKSGGSTKRMDPGKKKSVWDMSKEEFEDEQQRVLRGL